MRPPTACTGKVEAAIRMGGLADIKSERIKAILATLLQERGRILPGVPAGHAGRGHQGGADKVRHGNALESC